MDFFSVTLMMCIGNAAGWLAWLYWPGSRYRLLVDVAAAVAGALVAAYVFRLFFPIAATIGLIVCGSLGALLPLWGLRLPFRRGRRE